MAGGTLILVTNDDGVFAPGLKALAEELQKIGRVVVVAPDRDNSAASHSLTMQRPLLVRELAIDSYSVDGTPTDCVILAVGKILDRTPDLVVSGINPGPNLCDDVSYSGTVSAATEGTMLGIPSFAASLVCEEPCNYELAAQFAGRLARMVLGQGLPPDTLLNINVPAGGISEITGIKFTRQLGRILTTFDIGNLSRCKSNHLIIFIIAKYAIEVMKITTGSAHDDNFFGFFSHLATPF